ncbi:MAG: hypothetical protein DAHOPDDO_00586 [Ignavibacteriaceae bacterium]|nr:hypothetical protein [Ignavibacteriaceae bacterium]
MYKFTLYIDEAGNTGSRYLDINQPFFILGGWLIENSKLAQLSNAIEDLEKKYSSTGHELKGKNLVKHLRGQEFILNVNRKVASFAGMPLMFIVEKRYMICAKIVETFLDPYYNKLVENKELLDLDGRQNTAQEVYNTNSQLIEEFAEAYRTRNSLRIKELVTEWADELTALGNHALAKKVFGAIENIEEEITTEFEVFESKKGYDSLNLPMLVAMFQYIEHNLPSQIKIIHDNNDSFKETFYNIFELLNNNSEGFIQFIDSRRLYFGLKSITDFTFCESKSTPILRAADYAVSATYDYIKKVFNNNEINDTMNTIAMMTIGGIYLKALTAKYPELGYVPDLGTTYSSRDFVKKAFSKLSVPE